MVAFLIRLHNLKNINSLCHAQNIMFNFHWHFPVNLFSIFIYDIRFLKIMRDTSNYRLLLCIIQMEILILTEYRLYTALCRTATNTHYDNKVISKISKKIFPTVWMRLILDFLQIFFTLSWHLIFHFHLSHPFLSRYWEKLQTIVS